MTTVAVTGGAGFIGRHLARKLLDAGHRVRILDNLSPQVHGQVPADLDWLDRDGIEFVRGSVCEPSDVSALLRGAGSLVHLAAETGTGQSMYQVARYNAVNVGGTALLLDTLANDPARTVARVVLASSRSIYGEGAYTCPHCATGDRVYPGARSAGQLRAQQWEHACPVCSGSLQPVATAETDPARPASVYAATKYAQEDLVRVVCDALGIDHVILRLQNVYGEGQSLTNPYTGILSIFSTRIRRGDFVPIFEDGLETRDFVHVDDVAGALLAAIDAPEPVGEVLNVGLGEMTSVMDIGRRLSEAFGVEPQLKTTGEYRLGDIRHNCADIGRLKDKLQFQPTIGLAQGMQRFAAWVGGQPVPEDRLNSANAELKARNLMG